MSDPEQAYPVYKDLKQTLDHLFEQLAKGRTGYFFGPRIHPIKKILQFHNGQDIPHPEGTPIHNLWDGFLSNAWFDDVYGGGNSVRIGYKDKPAAMAGFCHLSAFAPNLKKGMAIPKGMVIGYTGKTGLATGAHLHLTLRKMVNKKLEIFDPLPILCYSVGMVEMPFHEVG